MFQGKETNFLRISTELTMFTEIANPLVFLLKNKKQLNNMFNIFLPKSVPDVIYAEVRQKLCSTDVGVVEPFAHVGNYWK